MKSHRFAPLLALLLVLMMCPGEVAAVTLGQFDDFEDGTTQNWLVSLLGAPHPAPPANVPGGGPAGVDDNYLQLTSIGGGGAGSRLTVINVSQWAGDYLAAGVQGISMDLRNLSNADLSLRLAFNDAAAGPPANVAVSSAPFSLAAGGGWTSAYFPIAPGDLTAILGDASLALSGATELRLFHGAATGFPGEPIVSQLGVDNIRALSAPVPEPSTGLLLGIGVAALVVALVRARAKEVPAA